MVKSQLNTFPQDFQYTGRFPIDLAVPPPPRPGNAPPPLSDIHDARPPQAAASSPAAFFDAHGFVLLDHKTQVADWDNYKPIYETEIEALIRDVLLPGQGLQTMPAAASLARRGRGTENGYAGGVHQDCGLGADDYEQLVGSFAGPYVAQGWRKMYDQPHIEGFMMLDFWRPTNMSEPLRHMPLALCDPNSVAPGDILPTIVSGIAAAKTPTYQMCLRRNPAQTWYYYPDMTVDEVLVFKLFDSRKSDAEPFLRSCFHTAFTDPTTPDDAEARQSCEYRVGLFVLNS